MVLYIFSLLFSCLYLVEPITCGYIDPPVSQMFILSKKSYSHVRDQVPEEPDSVLHILFEKVPAMVNNFLPLESEDDPTCLVRIYLLQSLLRFLPLITVDV